MEPRVLSRGSKLHLVYDISTRVRCSALLSTPAPNGGSVVLYGHDDGLSVVWRGGRRLKDASTTEVDVDESVVVNRDLQQEPDYEDEEELDTDLQYPRVHHSFNIAFDQPVIKIALLEAPEQRRRHAESLKVVIATLRGRIQLLEIPLHISSADATDAQARVLENALMLKTTSAYVRSLVAKAVYDEGVSFTIAAITDRLELWRVPEDSVSDEDIQYQSLLPSDSLASVAMHPGLQSAQVLVTDKLGAVSAYDLAAGEQSSAWLYTLSTGFAASPTAPPARKRLIDAQFVLDGRAILALTDDGQWGIWDTSAIHSGKGLDEFVLSGYLDSSAAPTTSESGQKRTALTPMTPNTRKTKSENFFAAPQTRRESAPSGGISVVRAATSAGVIDESVMIWYQTGVYNIPSMQAFWQRSTSGTGGLGSLHTPGIASILGVNLFSESINSLSQLPAASTASGIGQLKTQRDFIVSTGHRLIIVQSQGRPSTFTQTLLKSDTRDQRMLDAGDLDIRGVDRLLDDMNGRSRKVGFAH